MKIAEEWAPIAVVGVVGCAILIMAEPAQALSCATNDIRVPVDGAADVPTNTLVWSYGRLAGATTAKLLGPAGQVSLEQRELPIFIGRGQGTTLSVLAPTSELAPQANYTIEVRHEDAAEAIIERFRFTTGEAPSEAAPALPELDSIDARVGLGWFGGVNRWLELGVSHDGILIGDSDRALGDVASIDDLWLADGAEVPTVISDDAPIVRWVTTSSPLPVGVGDCVLWPENGDEHEVRLGVLDLAGNFSGWLGTELTLPPAGEAQALADARAEADALAAAENRARLEGLREAEAGTGCALDRSSSNDAVENLPVTLGALLIAARRCDRQKRPVRRTMPARTRGSGEDRKNVV